MKKILFTGIITLLILNSCSNTQLISSWKAPGASVDNYSKVLVVSMTGAKDRELRETIEMAMAKRLQEQGIAAEASSDRFGPKSFRTMSEEDAVKMVNDNGFDAVIVIALLDKNQESNYTPGYISSTPYAVIRNRWYGNYTVLYDRVYNPGYYTTTTDYTLEADFYKTRGNRLIYSAHAKSFDPNSAYDLAGDFSKTVVLDMLGKGVLRKAT